MLVKKTVNNYGAYMNNLLQLNLGYAGWIELQTPTIIEGRYKVELFYGANPCSTISMQPEVLPDLRSIMRQWQILLYTRALYRRDLVKLRTALPICCLVGRDRV